MLSALDRAAWVHETKDSYTDRIRVPGSSDRPRVECKNPCRDVDDGKKNKRGERGKRKEKACGQQLTDLKPVSVKWNICRVSMAWSSLWHRGAHTADRLSCHRVHDSGASRPLPISLAGVLQPSNTAHAQGVVL